MLAQGEAQPKASETLGNGWVKMLSPGRAIERKTLFLSPFQGCGVVLSCPRVPLRFTLG